jgi:hypothetical protein
MPISFSSATQALDWIRVLDKGFRLAFVVVLDEIGISSVLFQGVFDDLGLAV